MKSCQIKSNNIKQETTKNKTKETSPDQSGFGPENNLQD